MRSNRWLIILGIVAVVFLVLGGGLYLVGQAFGGHGVSMNMMRNRRGWNIGPISIGKTYDGPFDNKTIELEEFTSLEIDVSMIQLEIEEGDAFRLQLIDIPQGTLLTSQTGSNLKIYSKYERQIDYSIGDLDNKAILTIPKVNLDNVNIELAMGLLNVYDLQTKELSIESSMTKIEVRKLVSQGISINSSMADVRLSGEVLGNVNVENSMGNVDINLKGNAEDYAYRLSNSMGSVYFDRRSIDGLSSDLSGNDNGMYRITVNNSMGDIDVVFE